MRIKSVLRYEANRRKVFLCMSFPNLNLPPITLRTRPGANGRPTVWDVLRRRYVTLTAEEWVRQHFVHYLIAECGYPAGLLANEIALDVGGVRRRCDTVLFAREGLARESSWSTRRRRCPSRRRCSIRSRVTIAC